MSLSHARDPDTKRPVGSLDYEIRCVVVVAFFLL